MAERRTIPKKIRFEVFKRDHFTCQYCGRHAPNVILECDHIKPVAEGGENTLLNLVTSCVDCNRGKGKVLLSNTDEVDKKFNQLEEMAIKREQMEMMLEWQDELINQEERQTDFVLNIICGDRYAISEAYRARIKMCLSEFPFDIVTEAAKVVRNKYITIERYSVADSIDKMGGICYNKMKARRDNDGC